MQWPAEISDLHVNSKIRCKQILANKFADVGRLSKRFVTSLNLSWRNPNTLNPRFTRVKRLNLEPAIKFAIEKLNLTLDAAEDF